MKKSMFALVLILAGYSFNLEAKTCSMDTDLKVRLTDDLYQDFQAADDDSKGEACELLEYFSKSIQIDVSRNDDTSIEKKLIRIKHLLEITTNQDESSFEEILRIQVDVSRDKVFGVDPQMRKGDEVMGVDPQMRKGDEVMGVDPQMRKGQVMGVDPQMRKGQVMGVDPQMRKGQIMGVDPKMRKGQIMGVDPQM